jgi:hypothetical protein
MCSMVCESVEKLKIVNHYSLGFMDSLVLSVSPFCSLCVALILINFFLSFPQVQSDIQTNPSISSYRVGNGSLTSCSNNNSRRGSLGSALAPEEPLHGGLKSGDFWTHLY